jgi:hypothetical protein
MHITSETKTVLIISLKALLMPLYDMIAGTVVIIIPIFSERLLPLSLMFAMATACAGQVVLDIGRHAHHRLFKM